MKIEDAVYNFGIDIICIALVAFAISCGWQYIHSVISCDDNIWYLIESSFFIVWFAKLMKVR